MNIINSNGQLWVRVGWNGLTQPLECIVRTSLVVRVRPAGFAYHFWKRNTNLENFKRSSFYYYLKVMRPS